MSTSAHKKRISNNVSQTSQRSAHRRNAAIHAFGCAGHAFLGKKRIERSE
jgi:hypothetical protein